MKNPEKFLSENYFANYINPKLEIRLTEGGIRGVFTTKPVKEGEIIFAEKPIAVGIDTFK